MSQPVKFMPDDRVIPTWEDLERAALFDHAVAQCLSLYRQGHLTREQALLGLCLHLLDAKHEVMRRILERSERMARIIGGETREG